MLTPFLSPRLESLADRLEQGDTNAVDSFWTEMTERTTPLIEADPANEYLWIVTFLWREVEPTTNVVLVHWLTPEDLPEKKMSRIEGTDLWFLTLRVASNVRSVYRFAPNDNLVPRRAETDWDARRRKWQLDPLNPKLFLDYAELSEDDRLWHVSSIVELPDAPVHTWHETRTGVPCGTVEHHRFVSAILGNERDLWVYQPAIEADRPRSLLIAFDGQHCVPILRLPTTLDNLQHAGEFPPAVAVMVGNVDRGAELPCNPRFADALADELAPWVRERFSVSHDPADATLAGQSYGGLASVYCALERPESFGSALSQSGSFWWMPNPHGGLSEQVVGVAPDFGWLNTEIATRPRVPIRIYMDAGILENRSRYGLAPSLLHSNRHLRDILLAKGYDFTYREFSGSHDHIWWRDTLADGLIALNRGRMSG